MGKERGFTLVEMLVTGVLLLLVLLFLVPAAVSTLARAEMEGATREATQLFVRARMEAIQSGNPVIVQADLTSGSFEAWADVDRDGTFNPDSTKTRRSTDYSLNRVQLPSRVELGAPAGESMVQGLTVADGKARAVFRPDGSVDRPGALRLGGNGRFVELRIEPQVAPRVELRHWDGSAFVHDTNPNKELPS